MRMRKLKKMAASKGQIVEWTVREQLILASAVQRSGDQNWVSVSRAVKPLVEDARPPDYFSQKNCALQYSAMLDKAKHPKRKRSSDSTPEPAVTVVEQIVRQLTEKRVKELSSAIVDTRKEYCALKKETEQIERGELDSELANMWEKVQAELAVKEATEPRGSRSRKSSTAASGTPDGDHPKRQKVAPAAGDGEKISSREKAHKSPEKRSSSSAEAHGLIPVSVSPSKEERMEVPPSENPSLVPSSPSTPAASITPRVATKKKALESLSLTSGGGTSDLMVVVHDESPLPYPMTVPKEEKLHESIAAVGGTSLLHPLSPDMHIIVQQPNIAAIILPPGTGTTPETNASIDAQKPQLLSPLVVPTTFSTESSVQRRPSDDKSDAVLSPRLVKHEKSVTVGGGPLRPQTVAEALSAAIPTPSAVLASKQPPTLVPLSPSPAASVPIAKTPLPPGKGTLLPPASHSPPKQPHPHTSTSTPLPEAQSVTMVSSVLSDPRLKTTTPTKVPSLLPTVYHVHATASKSKPPTTKSRSLGETEKSSEGVSATSEEKEQATQVSMARTPKQAKPLQDPSLGHKKTDGEHGPPAATPDGPPTLPSYTPPPTEAQPDSVPPHTKEAGTAESGTEEGAREETKGEGRVEKGTSAVTVDVSYSSPTSLQIAREEEEGRQDDDMRDTSIVLLDDPAVVEGGSSRRSSVSELPSSPLMGGGTTESSLPPSRGRRQTKTGSSKKLWATRSRKRKLDIDEGMSVESTDFDSEEEPSSLLTSAAPSPAPSQGDGDQDGALSRKQWKKAIMLVWRHAAQHKYANLFLHPVKEDDAPGYRDVIHRPMDLSSIKRNIETGVTTTDTEFQRDMLLMFQNAFMYNSSDHDVYDMAEKMRADVVQNIQDYLTTKLQLIVESSTPKVLRSSRVDKEGRKGDAYDEELLTPVKKRRTRADD